MKVVALGSESSVDRVLREAREAGLRTIVVIGFDGDGVEYFNASQDDAPTALWLLDRTKFKLLRIVDDRFELLGNGEEA